MNINEVFGQTIRKTRIKLGFSQEKLAQLSDVDRTYLPSIEHGKRKVSLEIAKRICDSLGITLEEAVSGANSNEL